MGTTIAAQFASFLYLHLQAIPSPPRFSCAMVGDRSLPNMAQQLSAPHPNRCPKHPQTAEITTRPVDLTSHYVELDDDSVSSVQSLEDSTAWSQSRTWDSWPASEIDNLPTQEEPPTEPETQRATQPEAEPEAKPEPHFEFKGGHAALEVAW